MANASVQTADPALRVLESLPPGQHRVRCPLCAHTREKHPHDKSMSVSVDGEGVQYTCWHCEATGGWVYDSKPFAAPEPDPFEGFTPHFITTDEDTSAVKYLTSRGIDASVAGDHVIDGHYTFHGKRQSAIGFVYRSQEPNAIKWRSTEQKSFSQQNTCRDLWRIDTYKKGNDILICEGELDALAWLSTDLPDNLTVVSIPNGAPAKVSNGKIDPRDDKKFAYVWAARDAIESASRIYINADKDGPGQALESELIRRLPTAKLWITRLGDNKDAAECLEKHGATALREYLDRSQPVPLMGVHAAEDFESDVHDIYRNGGLRGAYVGIDAVDRLLTVPLGMLTVVTGFPSSGKSDFIDQMCVKLAENHGWKTAYCSFEKPPELHIPQLAQKIVGKPFFDAEDGIPRMSREERDWAVSWINEHFLFMDYRKGSPSDIEGILEAASQAVMRMGCRVLVIDPYNFLDRPSVMSETDWVSHMLTLVTRWARAHDAHVFFVAHPAKPQDRGPNSDRYICTGIDISGSANWFNKADIGLTLHRNRNNENSLHVWKVRWSWIGQNGASKLRFTKANGRWTTPSDDWRSRVGGKYDWSTDALPPLWHPDDVASTPSTRTSPPPAGTHPPTPSRHPHAPARSAESPGAHSNPDTPPSAPPTDEPTGTQPEPTPNPGPGDTPEDQASLAL